MSVVIKHLDHFLSTHLSKYSCDPFSMFSCSTFQSIHCTVKGQSSPYTMCLCLLLLCTHWRVSLRCSHDMQIRSEIFWNFKGCTYSPKRSCYIHTHTYTKHTHAQHTNTQVRLGSSRQFYFNNKLEKAKAGIEQ